MKVLVACEFSGAVREAFRKRGHDATSCDLLPARDDSVHHYQGDVRDLLDKGWDLLIAHPPCTALCVSGNRYYSNTEARTEAVEFFRLFLDAPVERICVENPVGVISTTIRPPDQYIQPYDFGHDASKKTGLWLKNLPLLVATERFPGRMVDGRERWGNQTDSGQNNLPPSEDRGYIRSVTYSGIASAMAEQWG
jgi:site-specific DNA-cytosine methylase